MPSLVLLIVYGLLAAGVTFGVYTAWSGFKEKIAQPYVAAQIKADQAKIDEAENKAKAAEAESGRSKDETKACLAKGEAQNSAVKGWQDAATKAQGEAARLRAAQKKQDAETQSYIDRKTAEAAAASNKSMTCAEELGKTRATLIEALKRRGIGVTPPPAVPK